MEDLSNFTVLKTLDNSPRFIFWDLDEFFIMIFPFFLGIITTSLLLMPSGLVLKYFYSKIKKRYPRGKLKHLLYRHLPKFGNIYRKSPPSHFRNYML